MGKRIHPNIPNLIMMIRPDHFGFNHETAESNSFQHRSEIEDAAKKAQNEFDEMVTLLRSNGIEVRVFEDQKEALPDVVFPNNWISHIPDGPIVIYPMYAPLRQKEIRKDIIDWSTEKLNVEEVLRIDQKVNEKLFLEGTGSIVFDHEARIAYACESPRTNLQLLTALCDQIGYRAVSFESVDVNGGQIYHTNVMMSVGSKLVIICLESISNNLEREMVKSTILKSGKQILDISYRQMNHFAGNALEVLNSDGKKIYVFSKASIDILSKEQIDQLEQHYKVLSVSIPTIEELGGGSVRCMMAGFFN